MIDLTTEPDSDGSPVSKSVTQRSVEIDSNASKTAQGSQATRSEKPSRIDLTTEPDSDGSPVLKSVTQRSVEIDSNASPGSIQLVQPQLSTEIDEDSDLESLEVYCPLGRQVCRRRECKTSTQRFRKRTSEIDEKESPSNTLDALNSTVYTPSETGSTTRENSPWVYDKFNNAANATNGSETLPDISVLENTVETILKDKNNCIDSQLSPTLTLHAGTEGGRSETNPRKRDCEDNKEEISYDPKRHRTS